MNTTTKTPNGKDDPERREEKKSIGIFGAVWAVYRSAWTRKGKEGIEEKKQVYVVISASVSLVAPFALVFAVLLDASGSAYSLLNSFRLLFLLVPSIFFVVSCHTLMKYKKDAPLLAFSVFMFTSGVVFTVNEIFNPTDPENSPWGDFFLAFSAFCVMIEEFSLLSIYEVAIEDATEHYKALIKLTTNAQKEYDDLANLHNNTKTLKTDAQRELRDLTSLRENAEKLYANMKQQPHEWYEPRQTVLLKALGVSVVIALAFMSMCG